MKRLSLLFAVFLIGSVVRASEEALPSSVIQDLIDAAEPGSTITVPAGIYHGSLVVRDTITVIGEGAGLTILDGQAAKEVVTFGKEGVLIGFTLRNGKTLAAGKGNFIGIFECSLENFSQFGILFEGGSGVVANNIITGNGSSSVGILCYAANPLVINNIIENNRIGFQWLGTLIPSVLGNLIRNNAAALEGPADGAIVLERNLFDGNGKIGYAGNLPASNVVGPVDPAAFVLQRGVDPAAYAELMNATYEAAVKDHPIIIYDLHDEAGTFDAVTLFPWATFTVSASAVETVIRDFEAYDWVADRPLRAEYVLQDDVRPSVRVNNPELVEKMRERYVLENVYVHPGSYYSREDGSRVFKRMTNLAQIELLLPAGYRMVSATPAAVVEERGGRTFLSMHDFGATHIEVVMEPVTGR